MTLFIHFIMKVNKISLSAETAIFSSRFTQNEEVVWGPVDHGSWYDVVSTVQP